MTPAEVRRYILETVLAAGKGHIASAFSWVEIAVALHQVMKPDDRLVLSKTHGHLTLDALWPDPDYPMWAGWPYKCSGSLGQGLGLAAGMALANKLNKSDARVFCVLGDAELHEGAIWEAMMFAAHHKLNLTAIIDDNLQCCANNTADVLGLHPLREKFTAFGWDFVALDGHHLESFEHHLKRPKRPICLRALTIKGRGIPFMEANPAWHHQIPTGDELEEARRALA